MSSPDVHSEYRAHAGDPPARRPAPELSIVIVSYNTCEQLRRCLASIVEVRGELSVEVIVVDNASVDGSAEMVLGSYPEFRLIRNPLNAGFAAANNTGFTHVHGEFILLLNPDTVLTPGALEGPLGFLKGNSRVGVLGCLLLNQDGTEQLSARRFPTIGTLLLENSFLYKLLPHRWGNPWVTETRVTQDVDVVKGAYLLTRSDVLASVGPLDTRFFLYSEEQDWCYRIKQAGWRVVYWPHARVYHIEGESSPLSLRSSRFLIYESETIYFRKHFGAAYAFTARIVMVGGILLRCLLWGCALPLGLFLPGKRKVIVGAFRRYLYALAWNMGVR